MIFEVTSGRPQSASFLVNSMGNLHVLDFEALLLHCVCYTFTLNLTFLNALRLLDPVDVLNGTGLAISKILQSLLHTIQPTRDNLVRMSTEPAFLQAQTKQPEPRISQILQIIGRAMHRAHRREALVHRLRHLVRALPRVRPQGRREPDVEWREQLRPAVRSAGTMGRSAGLSGGGQPDQTLDRHRAVA